MRILRLDGLRAVAILCVFLHHQQLFAEGWIGVELFFVLSGYLITTLLRRDRDEVSYWKPFYLKRVTRIIPPLAVLILIVAYCYHPPTRSLLAYLFFFGNFASGTTLGVTQLSILWSLAVEEHFYLFFPFAVRYLGRTGLLRLLVFLLALEPMLRLFATPYVHNFFLMYCYTFYHLDGLLMGALLALLAEDLRAVAWCTRWSAPAALLCLSALLLFSAFDRAGFNREANSRLFNTFGYTLVSASCMAIVAWVLWHPDAVVCRVLETRASVFLGAISYGFYLYHQQVVELLEHLSGRGLRSLSPLSFALAVFVSWVSFRVYEQPIMRWGHRLASRAKHHTHPHDLVA